MPYFATGLSISKVEKSSNWLRSTRLRSLKFQNLNIETVRIKDDSVRGLWEVFSAAELSTTVGNVFLFKSESGRVRISDVVLWYQRNI